MLNGNLWLHEFLFIFGCMFLFFTLLSIGGSLMWIAEGKKYGWSALFCWTVVSAATWAALRVL